MLPVYISVYTSKPQHQLGNAGWVVPVIYRHLDGSICLTLVAWKVPDGCHYCLCWPRHVFRSMQELTFPAAEGTAAGMVRSCSSVYKTEVRLLAMALWDVARFLCEIRCASGWADLAICICHCAGHPHMLAFWAALSILRLSYTCLRMAAALTGDQAVLSLPLRTTSLTILQQQLCQIWLPRQHACGTFR